MTTCICDPRKPTSRGECPVHGFATDPALMARIKIRETVEAMRRDELLAHLIELAEKTLHGFDDHEEPLLSDDGLDWAEEVVRFARVRFIAHGSSLGCPPSTVPAKRVTCPRCYPHTAHKGHCKSCDCKERRP